MELVNKNLKELSDSDAKIVYVSGVMAEQGMITKEERSQIKKGVLENNPNYKMLKNLVQESVDFSSISQYVMIFLKSSNDNSCSVVEEDFSPTTVTLINNTEDASPTGNLMLHRKIKQQINQKDYSPLNLINRI